MIWVVSGILVIFGSPFVATALQEPRRFTISDDIKLAHFSASIADPIRFSADPANFSPNGQYFVVLSEHGRIDLNRMESSLRIYRTQDVRYFLSRPGDTAELSPIWAVNKSTCETGPVITSIRWLADSKGVAFLAKNASGNNRLYLASISTKTVQPLTPEGQPVMAFDIRSSRNFVYAVMSAALRKEALENCQATVVVGTGRALDGLLFPCKKSDPDVFVNDLSDLWAVLDGRRLRVVDASSGQAVPIHLEGQRALALSPDGRTVVTALTVPTVPQQWEKLYPPAVPSSPHRIRAGTQNPFGFHGQRDVSEYVLIDISSGKIKPLTHSPIGITAGWLGLSHADWSHDGNSVVLSNTFLPPKTPGLSEQTSRPCVVVIDLAAESLACIEQLKSDVVSQEGRRLIYDVHFVRGRSGRVRVKYLGLDGPVWSTTFVRSSDGSWSMNGTASELQSGDRLIGISVRQGPNDSPVLIATDRKRQTSRIIWDPNPDLKNIGMGHVSTFRWKDKSGRDWVGGLYKPPDFVQGKRYPLVIQTHGFAEQEFRPSGASTTAFAAQELAAVGFLVLQISDCPIRNTPEEGPCQLAGYEAAVERLTADGLIDPDHVGIIGFSRTCYYVLEALTTGTLRFEAASITDGVDHGYLQYLLNLDGDSTNAIAREGDATIGARPFGAGLQQWLRYSPEFNMDKVSTPLEVVTTRPAILQMWEPYAALRYLNKPVDLVILNSTEHIFTNPRVRLASQGGTVDWFRFWLQRYESSDPAKSEQYRRWEAMRGQRDAEKMQNPKF